MQGVSLSGRVDFMTPFTHTAQRGSDVIRDLNVWLLIKKKIRDTQQFGFMTQKLNAIASCGSYLCLPENDHTDQVDSYICP